MADNIVKRIIAMFLDKDSAKKTQSDINALTDGIDKSFKSLATKIAGYFAIGFIIDKIKNIGVESVKQASDSDKAWKMLKGTIDNTGASFDALEDKLRATADAFQDATVHDDDAFAKSLGRLVTLTGDVTASLNNMGLVANVAAQFFDGDLAPATDLVAKAMNGNIVALQKMGIQAANAQQALEILASRSLGAAEREASTFDGQLKQLSNSWDDVLKDLGHAIIQSDGATDAMSVLRAAVQTLGQWVNDNKDKIRDWVTNGVKFAIDAADVFIRAVTGMAQLLAGGFSAAIGLATLGLGKLVGAWATVRAIEDDVREKLGQDVTERKKLTQSIRDQADALQEFGKNSFNAGKDKVAAGLNTLATPLFDSSQFTGTTTRKKTPGESNRPTTAAGAKTDQSEAIKKAVKDYEDAGKRINAMNVAFGEDFDQVNAELDRTTKLLDVLAENGVNPASEQLQKLAGKITFLKDVTGITNTTLNDLYKSLGSDLALAAATGATALDKLNIEANDVAKALATLLQHPNDDGAQAAIAALTERLTGLKAAVKDLEQDQAFAQGLKDMGEDMRQAAFFADSNTTSLEKLQSQRQALSRAIQIGIANNKTEDATFKQLVARYKEVTKAIDEQTTAMQIQAAAAEFLAEALGVALQGGIHEAAASKAKQTGIEALEWLVRAGAYALFGNVAGAAGALKTAASFGAVSLAWGALAAATPSSGGGSGAGGGAPSIPSSSGSGVSGAGDDVSSARSTASDRAANAQPPAPEVSVYLTGPGFDMLNPAVQRVVYGAQQQAQERYGANAKVRVVPHGDA